MHFTSKHEEQPPTSNQQVRNKIGDEATGRESNNTPTTRQQQPTTERRSKTTNNTPTTVVITQTCLSYLRAVVVVGCTVEKTRLTDAQRDTARETDSIPGKCMQTQGETNKEGGQE